MGNNTQTMFYECVPVTSTGIHEVRIGVSILALRFEWSEGLVRFLGVIRKNNKVLVTNTLGTMSFTPYIHALEGFIVNPMRPLLQNEGVITDILSFMREAAVFYPYNS